ncbi:MAG: hypothetical protein WAK72_23900, partial [Pseudolabrys sp.]
ALIGARKSALGHKRTFCSAIGMSAFPPIADVGGAKRNVRFVPKADISRFWSNDLSQELTARGQI